jgi:hypothetical protein
LWYAPQQSLVTVVLGSIHASITAIKMSADLSGRGRRNFFPGLALNTAKHLLSFNSVTSALLALSELALVDLGGLVEPPIFS